MKTSKRILCSLVLLIFAVVNIFVMPVSAASFTDVKDGSAVHESVTVLNKLGVINGYDDGTFKPDNNVTRAEFTAMLLRTRGLGTAGSMSLENPPFPDVVSSDVSWAIGNIRTARDMKIINGYDDGTFKPNNNVSYEEAIKMIVCALGYGEMGTDGAAWYSRYLMTATQLKFTQGAGGAVGTPATRATIAQMLYNCLEVQLAEDNQITTKTILENDLGLKKQVGYISSNPQINLSQPDPVVRNDEIQITAPDENGVDRTLTYKCDNVDEYADMLGAQITFYSKLDRGTGLNHLIMASVKNSNIVKIDVDLIEDNECDASTISYYPNEDSSRTTKAAISADSIVVYNDQLYGTDAPSSKYSIYYGAKGIPMLGSIKLLDRDGDNNYDVVFIDSYEAYIASSVIGSTYTIVDKSLRKDMGSASELVLDPTDLTKTIKFVNKSGNAATFSSIKTGSVLCVKESNANGGHKLITVVICNESVSGTVKGTSSNGTIKIDSKEYKSSNRAPWINAYSGATVVMSEPVMGDTGKFYLDMNGNIIGYDKTAQTSNVQYGYIMQAELIPSDAFGNDELGFNIITSSGKKIYYAYESTKINGHTKDSYADFLNELDDTILPSGAAGIYPGPVVNGEYSQLVKFSTKTYKGKTVIDEIITATDKTAGEEVEADELNFFAVDGFLVDDDCEYDSTYTRLEGATKNITLNSSTLIFKIPENRASINDYKKISLSDLKHGVDYKVEFYDVTGVDSAKVVLVYAGSSTAGEVTTSSPVMVITEINPDTDPAGERRYHLTGYVGNSPVDYWGSTISDPVFATVTRGDIVRLGTDDDGYVTLLESDIIFSTGTVHNRDFAIAKPTKDGNYAGVYPKSENTSSGSVGYKVIWGSAYKYDQGEKTLMVAHGANLLTGNNDAPADSDVITMNTDWFSGAKIYEYKTSQNPLEIIEHSSVDEALGSLQTYNYLSPEDYKVPTEVFIYMNNRTSVKTMIIVR